MKKGGQLKLRKFSFFVAGSRHPENTSTKVGIQGNMVVVQNMLGMVWGWPCKMR